MTLTDAVIWLVYTLAVMRLVRMINFDTVLDRPRAALVRLVRGNPVVVYFITCPWCVSIWAVLFTAWLPLYHADNRIVQYLGIVLAISHLVGIAAPLSSDPTVHAEPDEDDETQQ